MKTNPSEAKKIILAIKMKNVTQNFELSQFVFSSPDTSNMQMTKTPKALIFRLFCFISF